MRSNKSKTPSIIIFLILYFHSLLTFYCRYATEFFSFSHSPWYPKIFTLAITHNNGTRGRQRKRDGGATQREKKWEITDGGVWYVRLGRSRNWIAQKITRYCNGRKWMLFWNVLTSTQNMKIIGFWHVRDLFGVYFAEIWVLTFLESSICGFKVRWNLK